MNPLARKFRQCDGPTLLVAAAIYCAWFALIRFHALIPWWLMAPLGGYLVAWHFSLQHEAIHSFRGVPGWLRFAIVFPPIGLWFPFALYRRSHSLHHRDHLLTDPAEDTESYFVSRAHWEKLGRIARALLLFNQTLVGRLLIGPLLRLSKLVEKETARIRRGDRSHVRTWVVHAVALACLFWLITELLGMPWWQYVLLVAYPGMSLSLLRAFYEHRAAPLPAQRTASVESNVVFGLLFLYNNLHVAHHLRPTLPWYEIPSFYRRSRARLLAGNGEFVFRGYGEIARKYLLRPVFHPVHPEL